MPELLSDDVRTVVCLGPGAGVLDAVPDGAERISLDAATAGDADGLRAALEARVGEREVDLAVDDANRTYWAARTAFELLFPRLRAGGTYVLQGWGWAHGDTGAPAEAGRAWVQEPALTNLVVELVMLAGTDRGLVRRLEVDEDVVVAVRGDAPVRPSFQLAHAYRNRGLRFRPIL